VLSSGRTSGRHFAQDLLGGGDGAVDVFRGVGGGEEGGLELGWG